jgi:uncharacterized protein
MTTLGIGVRGVHTEDVLQRRYALPCAEFLIENYLGRGGRMEAILDAAAAASTTLLFHGVSLSLGTAEGPDVRHIAALRAFVDEWQPAVVSDHLCVTQIGGHSGHELWPLPFRHDVAVLVAGHIDRVQQALGREIAVENVSSYARFHADEMDEVTFLNEVASHAGCGILLDVNNLYVNGQNHGFDAHAALMQVDLGRVRQLHIAGHAVRTLPDGEQILVDTHEGLPNQQVRAMWHSLQAHLPQVPTILEWDEAPPALSSILEQMRASDLLPRPSVAA